MPGAAKLLFDANIFITSRDVHYPFDILPAFWDWIEAGHKAGQFFSIDRVRAEITSGDPKVKDPLRDWAKRDCMDSFFLPSKPSLVHWRKLASWAKSKPFHRKAVDIFLDEDCGDTWLISFAMHNPGYQIVTHEVSAPNSQKDIKLPDAAAAMGVETTSLLAVIQAHAGVNFSSFKP